MTKLPESLVFLREGITNFHHTGTFCATSKWAASALTSVLHDKRRPPLNILEVGAGTGAVTMRILDEMLEGDILVVCELNSRFMSKLKERLKEHPDYERLKGQIEFFEGPIQDLPEGRRFDAIVSALPFLNFNLSTVIEIFDKLERLSKPETVMTYYEYVGLRRLGKIVSPPQRKARIKELDRYFGLRHRASRIGRKRVWLNLLPINIYTLKVRASESAALAGAARVAGARM